jgi:hypothetical protein
VWLQQSKQDESERMVKLIPYAYLKSFQLRAFQNAFEGMRTKSSQYYRSKGENSPHSDEFRLHTISLIVSSKVTIPAQKAAGL